MAEDVTQNQLVDPPGNPEGQKEIQNNETYDFLTPSDKQDDNQKDNKNTEVTDTLNFPGFIPDDYKVKDTYKDINEELEAYKKAYTGTMTFMQSPEFLESFSKEFEKNLLESELEVDKLKAIKEALEGNPERALKQFFPDLATNLNISPFMSETEKIDYIDEVLTKKFGKDYKDKWNPNEVISPNSFSSQVFKEQNKIISDLEKQETEYREKNKPITPEVIEANLKQQYEEQFKSDGFTVEYYKAFVGELKEHKPTMEDMHHMLYFEHYIEEAKEEGRKEGMQNIKNGMKKVTSQELRPYNPVPVDDTIKDPDEWRKNLYRTKKVAN